MSNPLMYGEHSEPDRGRARLLVVTGGIILLLIALPFLLDRAFTLDRSDVHGAADSAAYELERTPIKGLGVNLFDVQQALSVGTRGRGARGSGLASQLRVTSDGEDSRGDLFEVTNSDGDHPVCLAVKVDVDLGSLAPSFPSTSVTDGPCQHD